MKISERFDSFLRRRLQIDPSRYETTKKALELFEGSTIVETGTFREWGMGGSTVIYAMAAMMSGGALYSIDVDLHAQGAAGSHLGYLGEFVAFLSGDSVGLLKKLGGLGGIDLLYLDSWGPGAEKGQPVPEGGFPYQRHSLAEMQAAAPLLHERSVVILDDDNNSPWGKPALTRLWLKENGWECVLEAYQSVWRRG